MEKLGRPAINDPEAARQLVAQLAQLFESPELEPVAVDLEAGTMGFVPADWARHDALAFHDIRAVRQASSDALLLPLAYLLRRFSQARPPSDPLHFILHHAFCGSTLLSRALAATTPSLARREPEVLFGAVKALAKAGSDPARRQEAVEALRLVLHLLARHRSGQVATVVKASDSATMALEQLFLARPESRGIFLFTSPATFVALAIKSDERRAWLRQRATWFERGLLPLPPGAEMPHPQTPPGRIALALWTSHLSVLRAAATRLGADRLRTLSTERLVQDVEAAAEAAARFFGLEAAPDAKARLAPLLTRHAKSGGTYDGAARARELAELRTRHGREIDDALAWAQETAGESALSASVPFSLLP